MTPLVRKLALTAHITSSVGWLGAVAAFLVLSIAGLTRHDAELVRGVYLAMELIGWFMIVPLSAAALLTGVVQALGTKWGLFQHYWVVIKFLLTVFATIALLLHQFTAVAGAARRASAAAPGTFPDVGGLGVQLVGDAGVALFVLLVITTLSVFKPWGKTPYGRRRQQETIKNPGLLSASAPSVPRATNGEATTDGLPLGLKLFLAVIGLIIVGFVALHLAGGGLAHHGF